MSLYYSKRGKSHNLIYTVGPTFSYCSKTFIYTCSNLSVHAYGSEFRGGNFKHFKTWNRTWKVVDVLKVCHKVAYKPQTAVEGQGRL